MAARLGHVYMQSDWRLLFKIGRCTSPGCRMKRRSNSDALIHITKVLRKHDFHTAWPSKGCYWVVW